MYPSDVGNGHNVCDLGFSYLQEENNKINHLIVFLYSQEFVLLNHIEKISSWIPSHYIPNSSFPGLSSECKEKFPSI